MTIDRVRVHLEVLTKPTARALRSPTYPEVGVYEWESMFAQFGSPPPDVTASG